MIQAMLAMVLVFVPAALLGVALVILIARAVGGSLWPLMAAAALLVLGSVPPTVAMVLIYARKADYVWAIRGPGVFAQLGGGPFWLATGVFVFVWMLICWLAASGLVYIAVMRVPEADPVEMLILRPELPGDAEGIRAVHRAAFGGPEEAAIVATTTAAW